MTDNILRDIESANRIHAGESVAITPIGRTTAHVRVPGTLVGACKRAGVDIEPCILVELVDSHGRVGNRWLCYSIDFHGATWMGQSIESPCSVNGAILWLETRSSFTMHGKGK